MSTLTSRKRSNTPSMTICDTCLTPVPSLPMSYGPGNPGRLCPACEARQALLSAAEAHLHSLIYPTVLAWARHWSAAGVPTERLAVALEVEGLHWHPDGAYERPSAGFESAAAVIREALAPAGDRHE
jgi:hypothetical protein